MPIPPPGRGLLASAVLGTACLAAGVALGGRFAGGWSEHPWLATPAAAAPADGAAPRLGAAPPTFADVVERASPGVVSVRTLVLGDDDDATHRTEVGHEVSHGVRTGSGFVLSRAGLVVTARHLTVAAARIVVEVPRFGRFDAELVGEDDITDLAVLRIANPPARLTPLELGRSEDLRAGDWIVAVGNPFGFKQSVTAGIVSFVGRHLHQNDQQISSEFLQFSAPVNPGSSGCPVLDLSGRVVGVTTQAADAAQAISFAIPSRTLAWVIDSMDRSEDGRVHRGQAGISLDSRNGVDDYGKPLEGALVLQVAPGGAAAAAGLRTGDIVLLCEGQAVADAGELYERITRSRPGSTLHLSMLRGDQALEPVAVTLRDAAAGREHDGELFR